MRGGNSTESARPPTPHNPNETRPMAKPRDREPKTKACAACGRPTVVAYRVRRTAAAVWEFVCPDCLERVKSGNPHYAYGGTWKGERH